MTNDDRPWEMISGHTANSECLFLSKLAEGRRVLEIGTHHGKATSALASTALSVVTIDTYKGDAQIGAPSLEDAKMNLRRFSNVKIVVGDWRSQNIDPDDYSLIFYDGCHTEEGEFLGVLLSYFGSLAIHDYKRKEPAMSHVVESVDRYAKATGRSALPGAGSIVWFVGSDWGFVI